MGRDGQSVVEKVERVLDCYIRAGEPSRSFIELLDGTELSRASLHRTLSELVESGFLTQAGRGEEYRLGPLLRSAAALSSAALGLASIARPRMEQLRDRCRETVVLAELHGASVVPVLRAEGLHEMRMNQEVGKRYPAHAGATGKVLLANLPAGELKRLLGGGRLEALTPATTTSRRKLAEELALIRRAGVGVTRGERVPDAVAISAPILDAGSRTVAALTISGIASRYEPGRLSEDARAVRETAEAISAELGHRASERDEQARRSAADALEEICERAWQGGQRRTVPAGRT